MEGWTKFIGRNVKIVFDDSKNASIKLGKIISANDSYIFLETDYGEEVIAISRIVRLELLDGRMEKNEKHIRRN